MVKTPMGEEISDDEYAILMSFMEDVCERSKDIDPSEEYDWNGIAIGYFIAKSVDIEESHKLARIARYHYQYWQK
jgi:hypothetical protein